MGDRSRRERSRSSDIHERITPERLERFRNSYKKCKEQKGSGKNRKRRLKGVCCGLLRWLIQTCLDIVQSCPPGDSRIEVYTRRQRQAERKLQRVTKSGWLPRRDQNILDLGEDSEAESEIREPVCTSETESEEDQAQEPIDPRGIRADLRGASSSSARPSSRAERIRAATVTSRNPLLAERPTIDHRYLRQHGVITNPQIRQPLDGLIVSLDWHQVLDTIRTKYKTIRTEEWQWYYLLDPVKHHLSEIRRLAESKGDSVKIIVLSYTHSPAFQDKVLGLIPYESNFLDLAVTTRERTGLGGKLWTLKQICSATSSIWHADDNTSICREIVQDQEERIRAAGIKVPSHWREQRELHIFWYRHILEALDLLSKVWKDA